MTKAEMKKMVTEQKYDFITKVYEVILGCIPVETRAYRKKIEVRIVHQNYNRYIRFHSYGQDLAFRLYGDGNVDIELREALHSTHTEVLFEYDGEAERQNAFLAELKELAPSLIKVFIGRSVHDFHSYMDYVSENVTAMAAYNQMMQEYGGSYSE